MKDLSLEFDPVLVAIDWLDVCRSGDIERIVQFYEDDATLGCLCNGEVICAGKQAIAAYWEPRLKATSPTCYTLEDLEVVHNEVVVEFRSHEGRRVRMHLEFGASGKIAQSRCGLADEYEAGRVSFFRH